MQGCRAKPGNMATDVALGPEMIALYPARRLIGPANVLIMRTLHRPNIASELP